MTMHYTLSAIDGMRDLFAAFIKELYIGLKKANLETEEGIRETFNFDKNQVEVIFSTNPLKFLGIDETKDSPFPYDRAAVVFIHGVGFSFAMSNEDMKASPNENPGYFTTPEFNYLIDGFIQIVKSGMARHFYEHGMEERLGQAIEAGNFEFINETVSDRLTVGCHKYGYDIILYDKDLKEHIVKHSELETIKPLPEEEYKQKFTRLLKETIIIGLAYEDIWKDHWSAPLFG